MKENKRSTIIDYLRMDPETAGSNISWASIFAGVVTFIAIFITLSFIGSAIGFGMVEPASSDPVNGAATGVMIWTVISVILSFMCAGFVAGLTSQRVGMIHGFLTWATTLLALVILVSFTTASVVSGIGNMLGSVAKVAGQGVQSSGQSISQLTDMAVSQMTANMDVDTDELQNNMREILRDTNQEKLQPEYIENQMNEAVSEVQAAAKDIVLNPENANQILNDTITSLTSRAQDIGQGVDKDAVAEAVAANTDLSEAEAEEATNNLFEGIQTASTEAQGRIEDLSMQIEQQRDQLEHDIYQARVAAGEVTDQTAAASIWSFIALLIGMIITSVFGVIGNRVGSHPETKLKA